VNLNWEEDRKRDRRRIHLRWVLGIGLVILLGVPVGIVITQHRAAQSAALKTLPGFRDGGRTVDTAPFDLLQFGSKGPTTIPGGPDGSDNDDTVPGDWQPPAPTTSTTTTLPIPARQKDPICDAFVVLISYARSGLDNPEDPAAFATKVIGNLTAWIEELRTIDARTYAGAISKLDQVVAQLRDRPSADELRVIMLDLTAPDSRTKPLVDYAMKACPAVLAAR